MQRMKAATVASAARITPALEGAGPVSPGCSSPGAAATNAAAATAKGSALQNTAHRITAATPNPRIQVRRDPAGMRGTPTSTSKAMTAMPNSERPIQPPTSAPPPPMMSFANSSAITIRTAITTSTWVRGTPVMVLMPRTVRGGAVGSGGDCRGVGPRPVGDLLGAADRGAVVELQHRHGRRAGQLLGALAPRGVVERLVGQDRPAVGPDDVGVVSGVREGVVGVGARMATRARCGERAQQT